MNLSEKNTLGFTLTELIVVMGAGVIITSALLFFFSGSLSSYRSQIAKIALTSDSRIQLQRMADTIRNAQDNGGNKWLQTAYDDSLSIWTDSDGNGVLEQVTYSRDASKKQLIRTVGTVAGTIMQNLDASQSLFIYYGADGTAISTVSDRTPEKVKSIGIALALTSANPQDPETQTATTRVTPRQNLQGTVSQLQGPSDQREVIIIVPAGSPPSASNNTVTVKIQNPTNSAVISQQTIPLSDLNDGRLRVYENDMYALVNYSLDNGSSVPDWYVWVIMNIPAELNLLELPVRYPYPTSPYVNDGRKYYNLQKSKCMGVAFSTAKSECALGGIVSTNWKFMFLGNTPFQPILTYSSDGYKDYVRDIIVMSP